MTNKNPRTILAIVRVNARPYREGRSHPVIDEPLIQSYYDGLAQDPQKWATILKTAYEYANDGHPDAGVDPTEWWIAFQLAVRRQLEGQFGWTLQYPQAGRCGV